MSTIRQLVWFVVALNILHFIICLIRKEIDQLATLLYYFNITFLPLLLVISLVQIFISKNFESKKEMRKTLFTIIIVMGVLLSVPFLAMYFFN